MEVLVYIFAVVATIILFTGCLWLSMKAISMYAGIPDGGQYCTYYDLLKISTATAAISLVPYIGMFGSWVVLYYLLYKYTEAEMLEIIGMVIISQILAVGLLYTISILAPFTMFLEY